MGSPLPTSLGDAFRPLDRDRCFVSILVYHGLETDPQRLTVHDLDITPQRCLAEIRLLESLGFCLIAAQELEGLRHRPRPGPHLLICFDDAHLGTFEPLEYWLRQEQIPILLAVCPGIATRQASARGIFWWEEVRARFAATHRRVLRLGDAANDELAWSCPEQGAADFEYRCRTSPRRRGFLMHQLRRQTDDVSTAAVRCSPFVHRNMGWPQIAALDRFSHCTIAAHSLFHDTANQRTDHDLRRDAMACRCLLGHHLGAVSPHFVYPNGALEDRTDRVLAGCGFRFTYSVVGAPNPLPVDPSPAPWRLHRFHGFGYQADELYPYARQFNHRHRSLLAPPQTSGGPTP